MFGGAGEKSHKVAGGEEARMRGQLVLERSLPKAIQLVSRSSKKRETYNDRRDIFGTTHGKVCVGDNGYSSVEECKTGRH